MVPVASPLLNHSCLSNMFADESLWVLDHSVWMSNCAFAFELLFSNRSSSISGSLVLLLRVPSIRSMPIAPLSSRFWPLSVDEWPLASRYSSLYNSTMFIVPHLILLLEMLFNIFTLSGASYPFASRPVQSFVEARFKWLKSLLCGHL